MASSVVKITRFLAIVAASLTALVVLLVLAINHPKGQRFIERTVADLTDQTVILTGLGGTFPQHLALKQLELADTDGVWLTIGQLQLDWNALRLLAGEIRLDRLMAANIKLTRLPIPTEPQPESAPIKLPLSLAVGELGIGHLDLPASIAGKDISLIVFGSGEFSAIDQANAKLLVQPMDSNDEYRLDGNISADHIAVHAKIKEAKFGLLASLAKLQQPYPMDMEVRLDGPLSATATHLQLNLGPLNANAEGLLDFIDANTQLHITAQSASMPVVSGLSWQKINLSARLSGKLNQPVANGQLDIHKLTAAETEIGAIHIAVNADNEGTHVSGTLARLKSPQLATDPLQDQPLAFLANYYPAKPSQPLDFKLQHPSFNATGKVLLNDRIQTHFALNLPNLKRLSPLTGLDLQGKAELTIEGGHQDGVTELSGSGKISLNAGDATLLGLLGKQTHLSLRAKLDQTISELSQFDLKSSNVELHAKGKAGTKKLAGDYSLSIKNLAAIAPGPTGRLAVQGQLSGIPDHFNVSAQLSGELGFETKDQRYPAKPVTGKLQLDDLPKAPHGEFDSKLWLAGSPLNLSVNAKKQNAGLLIDIQQASWKSAHIQGQVAVEPTSSFPVAKLNFKMSQLADLQPLLGQALSGSVDGTINTLIKKGKPALAVQAHGNQIQAANLTIQQAALAADIQDWQGRPQIDSTLTVDGLSSEALSGKLQLACTGPLSALKLRIDAALADQTGNPIDINASALANTEAKQVLITPLKTSWRKETLLLREPLTFNYANGLRLDHLRLTLRQATLAMDGQISPTLALTAHLANLPVNLMALVDPKLNLTGQINADARLTGSTDRPVGQITISAADIKFHNQQLNLPTAQVKATAMLDGLHMKLDGHAKANDKASTNISGLIPFDPNAPLQLHANADIDLKLSDPLLMAGGQRLRGHAKLLADVAGTQTQPRVSAKFQLEKTEFRDYALGVNIADIDALVNANNEKIEINKFTAKAGEGQITAKGWVDLGKADLPLDITLTSRNARVLASDRMNVNLNTDLTLRGEAKNKLLALGTVLINRAEIRVPERLPAQIAVLNIQTEESEKSAAKPSSNTKIRLNLTVSAPGKIFVRGRGLDAELTGTVRLKGSIDQPQPEGVFKLRRGTFTIAGKTLTFSEGSVSFDGGSLTNPSLDFTASSTSENIKASLNVGGTANKPIITLSSVPSLPQDEVLARLLFDRGSAALSVSEMVQIGAALASLTGVGSRSGDPLEGIRTGLGLDRLSVGTSLEAGSYVAPGVYLGAKQGLTGSNPQAVIQIDLTKQLKLEATVGAGSSTNTTTPNTNSVGVIYQYEY